MVFTWFHAFLSDRLDSGEVNGGVLWGVLCCVFLFSKYVKMCENAVTGSLFDDFR